MLSDYKQILSPHNPYERRYLYARVSVLALRYVQSDHISSE